jgi:hypothetical protein
VVSPSIDREEGARRRFADMENNPGRDERPAEVQGAPRDDGRGVGSEKDVASPPAKRPRLGADAPGSSNGRVEKDVYNDGIVRTTAERKWLNRPTATERPGLNSDG